jgi:hypothetical protein
MWPPLSSGENTAIASGYTEPGGSNEMIALRIPGIVTSKTATFSLDLKEGGASPPANCDVRAIPFLSESDEFAERLRTPVLESNLEFEPNLLFIQANRAYWVTTIPGISD